MALAFDIIRNRDVGALQEWIASAASVDERDEVRGATARRGNTTSGVALAAAVVACALLRRTP
jgi:hypothetical protein